MASTDRKELQAIGKLLALNDAQLNQLTDLELLKLIVSRVKESSNQAHESLAFPQDVRNKQQIAESPELWLKLEQFNNQLRQDYTCRRQMLLRRLDCTVESFKWKGGGMGQLRSQINTDHHETAPNKSEHLEHQNKAKQLNELVHEKYAQARRGISEEPAVSMAHLLAIREPDCDRILNDVISSRSNDCKILYGKQLNQSDDHLVNLKQVIIPSVPDRGGRPNETRPPPRESFSQHRKGFRGHGGHGGHQHHRGRARR